MSAYNFVSIGIDQQKSDHVFSVAFQRLALRTAALAEAGDGKTLCLKELFQKLRVLFGIPERFPAGLQRPLLLWAVLRHIRQADAELLHLSGKLLNFRAGGLPDYKILIVVGLVRDRISKRRILFAGRSVQRNYIVVLLLFAVIIDDGF